MKSVSQSVGRRMHDVCRRLAALLYITRVRRLVAGGTSRQRDPWRTCRLLPCYSGCTLCRAWHRITERLASIYALGMSRLVLFMYVASHAVIWSLSGVPQWDVPRVIVANNLFTASTIRTAPNARATCYGSYRYSPRRTCRISVRLN